MRFFAQAQQILGLSLRGRVSLKKKLKQMSYTTLAIRNYAILAVTVILMSLGLTDTLTSPHQSAQQDKFDNYGQYLGVGLVIVSQESSLDTTWIPSIGKF